MSDSPLEIHGAPGSPYSRKLLAVLRYRRIPHRWCITNGQQRQNLPPIPVQIMPILVFPEEKRAAVDSTPLIRELEGRYEGRTVIPPDPAMAFLDALLEDYADEWVTKMMFHYRWAFAPDVEKAGRVLPLWAQIDLPAAQHEQMRKVISERQVERLWVVGSNQTTAPVIEASYERLLTLLDAHLTTQPYLLGRRPASSDFGLFGQLTQLVLFDPTSAAVAIDSSARVYAWTEIVEDLSGLEVGDDDWTAREAIPATLRALLEEVGRVYPPFLLANARALEAGADQVRCEIDGREWVQKPFPYQRKCLGWLREHHAGLAPADRQAVDAILAGTGCEALFA